MKDFYKYLPITTAEKDWNFYITTVGYAHIPPQKPYPAKDHPLTHYFTWNKGRVLNGYYLVFITQGQGIFESALTTPCTVSEGTSFVLFPNVWHRYKPDTETGWEEYWVGFEGSYPDEIMKNNLFNPTDPLIQVGLNKNLLILFQRLLEMVHRAETSYRQIISGITLEILGMLHSTSKNDNQNLDNDNQLIQKSIFLLREALETPLDIHQLIRKLPMGYSKFRKLFKEETGHSPHQYQLGLRMDKAKELLQTTQLNIKEIAFQTGFESEFYFSKFFRKKIGMSPTDYRSNEEGKLTGEHFNDTAFINLS